MGITTTSLGMAECKQDSANLAAIKRSVDLTVLNPCAPAVNLAPPSGSSPMSLSDLNIDIPRLSNRRENLPINGTPMFDMDPTGPLESLFGIVETGLKAYNQRGNPSEMLATIASGIGENLLMVLIQLKFKGRQNNWLKNQFEALSKLDAKSLGQALKNPEITMREIGEFLRIAPEEKKRSLLTLVASQKDRLALLNHKGYGKSLDEVSDILDVSPARAKEMVWQALADIKYAIKAGKIPESAKLGRK